MSTGEVPGSGRERLWTGQFVLLMVSAVFMYMMTFMLTPTLPLFAQEVGASTVAVAGGVIVGAYTLGSLLPRLEWGHLVDTWGRRVVYLLGVAIMTVISPVFTLASVLPVIVLLRLVQGSGFSASSTSAATMAADIVPASRRAEGIGYYTLANTVGMALGPELGLHVLQTFGSRWLFATSSTCGILALGIGAWLTYERRRPGARSAQGGGTRAITSTMEVSVDPAHVPGEEADGLSRLIERRALPASLVLLFVIMPYGAVMAYIGAYGIEQGVEHIGLFFTVFAVALLAVRLFVGRLSDRYGVTPVLVPAAVLMFAGLVLLWWASTLAVFLASAVLFGLGFGIAMPVLQATAYTLSPESRRGAASATVFATADIAYGVGAILLGVAISVWGYPGAFASLAALVVVALLLHFTVLRPQLLGLLPSHR